MTTDNWKPRRVFVPFQFQYKEQREQVKTMDAKTYQECALRTMADQEVILKRVSTTDMQLINGVIGLSNEAGELCDAIKRHVEYGKPRDRANIKEEVGDCFWRLRQICDAVGLTFEECMQANIDKLAIRYPKEFSDIQAHEENRDRAAEREVMTSNIAGLGEGSDRLPENWDKDHYTQNGQGWAEPEEICEDVSEASLQSVVRKKPLNHSYTRYCKLCGIQPVHKTNTLQICTPCFILHGEVKELTYDTATTD